MQLDHFRFLVGDGGYQVWPVRTYQSVTDLEFSELHNKIVDEMRRRQLRREFGLYEDDVISAAEYAIMDKLSQLHQKIGELSDDDQPGPPLLIR